MAGIPIPPEMLPRMDSHAEDKSAAWEHFTTRLKLYYTVAHTPKEAQVDTILFFAGTEATDRWKTLKEQMSAEYQASSDKYLRHSLIALKRVLHIGRPERSTLVTSNRTNSRPRLSWISTSSTW